MERDTNTHEQKETPSSPSFRVWLCGPFRVERLVGWQAAVPVYEVVRSADWSGSNCPRLLLKALLSLPRRQARREALLEMLWSDIDQESAVQNLHIATTKLRKVLQRPTGQGSLLLTEENATWYRLEGQDQIWVDVDAALTALDASEHAEGVLCLLEQTEEYLGRGGFLDEEDAEWATTRRATIDRARHRCRLLLASAYKQEKMLGKAEAVLSLLLGKDPTDEDVVCRLMELFHQQRMTHQALRLYEQTCQTLEEDGLEPTAALKDLAECLRSEKPPPDPPLSDPSSKGSAIPQEIAPPFSQIATQDTIGVSVSKPEDENGARGLLATDSDSMQQPTTAWTQQERVYFSLSPEEVELLSSFVRGDYTMPFDASKRDALQRIAALVLAASRSSTIESFVTLDMEPWERLFMAQQASSPSAILNAPTLEYFEQLLTISWQLCDGGQLAAAEGVLVSFLSPFLSLPKQEPSTAFLASHGLRLQSVLVHHHLRISDKVRLCEQAVSYAREAGNVNTLATALLELVWAYKYAKQPEKCLMPLQELLDLSLQVSPLVRSRIYSRYAVVLAESGRTREAEFYIGLAQEALPDDPASDPGFAFTDSSVFFFSYCAGLVCIHTGSIDRAFQAFEYYKRHPSDIILSERHRLEIANGQSWAAILDNDAERYAGLLEDVLVGSVRIRSQKRFDEALALFRQEMPASWLLVSRIKQLSEQYGLRREV